MRIRPLIVSAALAIAAVAPSAQAARWAGDDTRGPFALSNFYLKAGLTHIAPDVDSGPLEFYGLDDTAQAAMRPGPYPGTGVDVGDSTMPSLTIGWVLPWGGRRLSVETILAPPFNFDFYATGVAANQSLAPEAHGIPTEVSALGSTLGETWMLPPTVTLVFNPFPRSLYRPYVGVGASYLFSYGEKITNPVLNEVRRPEIDIEDRLAWVLQVGIDIDLYKRFFGGIDVKYVGGAEVTATVRDLRLNAVELFDPVRIQRSEVTMSLDPWVYQLTLGYRF